MCNQNIFGECMCLLIMSNQSQRVRKNVSPATAAKQGPIRATVPLSLMHQTCSPTKGLKSSPSKSSPLSWTGDASQIKARLSPETQSSSATCKGEKPVGRVSPSMRRTASMDTVYLLGQWQRDALYLSYCGRIMVDRETQTPDDFEEGERKFAQKKCGVPCGETLEKKFIRQRLQRSPRLIGSPGSRQSPLPVGTTSPTPVTLASRPLPIPMRDFPKPVIPKMRNSVEGLNQEIERIVLQEVAYFEEDSVQSCSTPEGHRAPIADLFRCAMQSVDTQTPFDSPSSSNSSHSVSPVTVPILLGHMDTSRPSSSESKGGMTSSPDVDSTMPRMGSSPQINKFLAREPPDGCEKVKIAEEGRNVCEIGELSCPKPSMNFVLLPSRRSAFYPLCGMSAPNGHSGTPPASERGLLDTTK